MIQQLGNQSPLAVCMLALFLSLAPLVQPMLQHGVAKHESNHISRAIQLENATIEWPGLHLSQVRYPEALGQCFPPNLVQNVDPRRLLFYRTRRPLLCICFFRSERNFPSKTQSFIVVQHCSAIHRTASPTFLLLAFKLASDKTQPADSIVQ